MPKTTRSPHPFPIAPHLTRHHAVGKARRAPGNPVAELKEISNFQSIPHPAPQQLAAPFSLFDPDASQAAENAGKLVFHCAGDVGGVNGTATQDAIAAAMEDQLNSAANARPAFFYILGDVVYYNG